MTANECTPSEGQESIAPEDWPKFSVEIQVEVPEEVVEVARERMKLGHEKGVVSEDVTLEDYLEDHMELDWEFLISE